MDRCCSLASSTCNLPSCERALKAKISRIKSVRSSTRTVRSGVASAFSRLRICAAESWWLNTTIFDQYLRTVQVPVLEWTLRDGDLFVRLSNCVEGFAIPVNVMVNGEERLIRISNNWSFPVSGLRTAQVSVDRNWYVNVREAGKRTISKEEISSLKLKACGTPPHF